VIESAYRGTEVDAVQVLDEGDDVSTATAATTVPKPLGGVDAEAIPSGTSRARTASLWSATHQLDAATGDLVFDSRRSRDVENQVSDTGFGCPPQVMLLRLAPVCIMITIAALLWPFY
jgi:hypothetical protein